MKCEYNKIHDRLSFTTLKHMTKLLDEALQQGGIKDAAKREGICKAFIFRLSYFLDNRSVQFQNKYYRTGFCFQQFTDDSFAPTKALVTDYKKGEMLHEAAIGISESHFTNAPSVPDFEQIREVYELK